MESKKEIINRVASGLREMKHLSNEELLGEHEERYVGSGPYWETGAELLSRIARGGKAIEAMEEVAKARLEDDYDEFAADVDLILRKYQQFCKEAADEN